jgi:hypothetical protein
MASRTDFEVKHEGHGWVVFARTSWWSDPKAVRRAGGLACAVPFETSDAARSWVGEQFSVPLGDWLEDEDGTFFAGIGANPVEW